MTLPHSSSHMPESRSRSITLQPKSTADHACLVLAHNDDHIISSFLQKLPFLTYSPEWQAYYMKNDRQMIGKLIHHCRGKIWIDLTQVRREVQDYRQVAIIKSRETKSAVSNTIDEETQSKIQAMEQWMSQKRYSRSTIKSYLSFIKQFFGKTRLRWEQLTAQVIDDYNYRHFIEGNKSHSTQNQWINAVKLFIHIHYREKFDLDEIERPRKRYVLPNVLSMEEVELVLQCTQNLKHRALLMLIYGCGLRIGETLYLQLTDIRSDERLIYIRTGKGRKDRRVPLSDKVLEALRRYFRTYKPKKYLFEGEKGGPYSRSSASKVFKRSARKAGIRRRVTLHTLRHSYATHLTTRGVNIQYLQEILGHNSPKTTMLYTHLSGKDIKEIRSPIDDMDL